MDESALYTGVDNEPTGIFENEVTEEGIKEKIKDQERQIKELTPKIQDLISIIETEEKSVMSIERFISATTQPEDNIRAELQAAALYKQYLGTLKTKFILALQEAKKG